jgi:hypothetical protein
MMSRFPEPAMYEAGPHCKSADWICHHAAGAFNRLSMMLFYFRGA